MRRFWYRLKLYVRHLVRGVIPAKWPPRLIEPGRGKRPDHIFGEDGCYRCGLSYWDWFESPDELTCD